MAFDHARSYNVESEDVSAKRYSHTSGMCYARLHSRHRQQCSSCLEVILKAEKRKRTQANASERKHLLRNIDAWEFLGFNGAIRDACCYAAERASPDLHSSSVRPGAGLQERDFSFWT